jgi:glycosyltransferase involved in cell wall biosynthesis
MEGFGMPLLEAMSCGCPVVASDIDVFREVGGSAALFAKVGDADEFCDRIESLLESPAKSALHREAGLIRSNLFSWSETARKTALGYSQC